MWVCQQGGSHHSPKFLFFNFFILDMTVLNAVNEYKKFVDEISDLLFVFSSVNGNERKGYLTELGWTANDVKGYQVGVMRYNPVERIKSALISDMPNKDALQNRLLHVWFELYGTLQVVDSNYFPVFDGSLLSHENKTLLESLTKIEGVRYAYEVLTRLEQIVYWANIRISNVYKYLVDLSEFSGLPVHIYKGGDKADKAEPKERNRQETFEISEKNKPVIKYVYDFLNGDAFNLTEIGFYGIVEAADFSPVFGKMPRNKAKIKYMVSYLSEVMGEKWYEHAVKSIGFSKSECSGAKVADYVKNKLDKSKIERIRMNKQW